MVSIDEHEGGLRDRLGTDFVQRAHVRQRQAGVDAPDGLLEFLHEPGRIQPCRSDRIGLRALDEVPLAEQALHEQRPVDGGRRRAGDAVVAFITNNAHDLAPRVGRRGSDPAADGRSWRLPPRPREVLRNHGHRHLVVHVGPGQRPPRNHPVPHRLDVRRANPLVAMHLRHLPGRQREVLEEDRVVVGVAVHGDRRGQPDRGHAGTPGRCAARPARTCAR